MKKSRKMNKRRCYRGLKTLNEAKKSFEETELIRPKRRHKNLPNSYDDYRIDKYKSSNCWKYKRKTQETEGNKKYTIIIDNIPTKFDIISNIEDHLVNLGYYFKVNWRTYYKNGRKNLEVTYFGKHIGNWPNSKYKD